MGTWEMSPLRMVVCNSPTQTKTLPLGLTPVLVLSIKSPNSLKLEREMTWSIGTLKEGLLENPS